MQPDSDKSANSVENNSNEGEVTTSVWKKLAKKEPPKEQIPVQKAEPEKVKGYRPPHLRVKMKQTAHAKSKTERVSRTAPDINNEQFFPTLASNRYFYIVNHLVNYYYV